MKNSQLRFGIVGTGMIASIIADAIDKSANAKLIAVSGRQIDMAQSFVARRQEGSRRFKASMTCWPAQTSTPSSSVSLRRPRKKLH
jgi:hypothetical protein